MAHVCKHTRKLIRNLEKNNLVRVVGKGEQFKLWPVDKSIRMRPVHMAKGGKSYMPLFDWAVRELGYKGNK